MRKNIFASFTIVCILIYFCASCSSTLMRSSINLGMTIDGKESKKYRISDVRIDSLSVDTARISCRVQKAGKKINGHLDVAIVSSRGEIVFKGSIDPLMKSRIGGYTITAIGFPFEFKLPISLLRNNSLHLGFHKTNDEGVKFFDCKSNSALE